MERGSSPEYFYVQSNCMWTCEMYDTDTAARHFNRVMELCYEGLCRREARQSLSPLDFGEMLRIHEVAWRRWRGDVRLLDMCEEARREYAERLVLRDEPAGYLREAFALSAEQGRAGMLRDLLAAGVSAHTRDLRDVALAPSALMLSSGHDECSTLLIEHDPTIILQCDGVGARATRYAARKRRMAVVRRQLDYLRQVDAVDERDLMSDTDLMWAGENGDADFLRALLDAGAEPRLRGRDGRTAFGRAIKNSHRECADILKTAEGGVAALASVGVLVSPAGRLLDH